MFRTLENFTSIHHIYFVAVNLKFIIPATCLTSKIAKLVLTVVFVLFLSYPMEYWFLIQIKMMIMTVIN